VPHVRPLPGVEVLGGVEAVDEMVQPLAVVQPYGTEVTGEAGGGPVAARAYPTMSPMSRATMCTRSAPTASSRPLMSPAIVALSYPWAGREESPAPRYSMAMTR
jgi:hypothetical protein